MRALFARVIRAAMVAGLTRNARAISSVDSPATSLQVSAIRASTGSTGWQAVNISRSTSSSTCAATSMSSVGLSDTAHSRPSSSTLLRQVAARRIASTPRRRATVISQPPGLSGIPDSATG